MLQYKDDDRLELKELRTLCWDHQLQIVLRKYIVFIQFELYIDIERFYTGC